MESFDQHYYATSCGKPYERNEEWLDFFGKIAKKIKQEINPGKTLDAGCALGFLVEKLRENDIEAYGCDISEFAINNAHESIHEFVFQASLVNPIQEQYDLIVSIEVLEHMQKEESEIAINNLCAASDDILFSSTPFDYKEATHWNVQPPDYWSEQFAKHEFFRDVNFDASFVTPWAVRYRKRGEPLHRLVKEYEQMFWVLKKENVDLRELGTETEAQLKLLKEKNQVLTSRLEHLQNIENEINDIKSSETWKILQKIVNFREKLKR